MKLRKNMLLLQTAAVLALATGLAAPVQAAEVDTTQQTSLTIALAEDDTTDVQKSIVADLSRSGVRQFTAELYRVASYTAEETLTGEADFAELDLENVTDKALKTYEKQQQEAEADPAASEQIPSSVWQGVWDEKAAQAVKLIQQNHLEPTATVQINYETCTDTTARYIGTAQDLTCGMYLVRLPDLNGAAYQYSAKDYLISVPYNASRDLSAPPFQPDIWQYDVTSYPKLDRHNYPAPETTPTPASPSTLTTTPTPTSTTTPTQMPDKEDAPTAPANGPWKLHLPQTGDGSHPFLWLVLMLVSGAGLVLILIKKHKKNGGQKK